MPELPNIIARKRAWARHNQLLRLGFKNYADYMQSGEWAAVKARYRASDRPQLCECGNDRVQIHHLTYERVGGGELPEDLIALCRKCHAMIHALERSGSGTLNPDDLKDADRAAIRKAELDEVERKRQMKRDAFPDLPLSQRLRLIRTAEACRPHKSVRNDLRLIRHLIERAEGKLDPKQLQRIDRRADVAASKLFRDYQDSVDFMDFDVEDKRAA